MKTLYCFLSVFIMLIALGNSPLKANHLTGGEMRYAYERTLPDGRQVYRIIVHIYRDALSGGAQFDDPLYMTVYNMDNTSRRNKRIPLLGNFTVLPLNDLGPCAKNVPSVRIQKATYSILDTVALNNNGYVYAHQRCCRSNVISNLYIPGDQGSTYSVHLTRNAMLANNTSPVFIEESPLLICVRSNFTCSFAANDINGNRRRYYLCEPNLGGNNFSDAGIRPETASRPPYASVNYANTHSATQPFGPNVFVDLNPNTGVMNFQPDRIGIFTVGVCIEEFDNNNVSLGFIKRDVQFNVADCIVASAKASINAAQPVEGVYASCKGQTIQFRNQSTDAQSYFWDFGVEGVTNDTSTLKEPIFNYPDSGRYDVTLIINRGQTCVDTNVISIRVYPVLTPDFDYTVICQSSPVEFTGTSTSTVDPIVKESWYYNNQLISQTRDFNYLFPSTGPYSVKLLVETSNGCQDSIVKSVSLPPFTESRFNIAGGIRQGQSDTFVVCNNSNSVTFNNLTPSNMPRTWSLGSITSTDHSPVHVFSDTGTYRIRLVVNPGTLCADTSVKWVRVLPVPIADFSFLSQCHQFPVEFTSIRNRPYDQINTVSWNFGDGTTSSVFDPKKDYTDVKSYNVRLNVTSVAGCTANVTKPVVVNPDPVADFDMTGEKHNQNFIRCDGLLAIVFEPKAVNAQTYNWNFGLGLGTTNSSSSMFVFPDTGTYNVQLIVNRGQKCTDTIVKSLRLIDGITKTDFASKDVCVNTAQTFTNQSVAVKNDFNFYLWDFGDNTTSTDRSPSKTYAQPGTYIVKLVVGTALGCKDSLEKTVTIFPAPVADFINDDACLNTAKFFNNTSTINSGTIGAYLWTFGSLGTSTDENPSFTFANAGNVNVRLRVTSDKGCVNTITKAVRTRTASVVDFSYTNHCVKAPVYFNDLSTSAYNDIVQWIWTFEPGQTKTGKNVNYTYSTPGKHNVKLVVVTSYGCRDSITKEITIGDVPKAAFNIAGNAANNVVLYSCKADYTVTFNNTSPANLNYLWSFGVPGANSTDEDPVFVYPDSGTFTVRLITEPGTACQDFVEKNVRILPPVVAAYSFTTECVKAPVFFTTDITRPFDPIRTILWNFGDGTTSNDQNPEKIYATSGNKNVRLTLTAESGCSATILRTVNVAAAPVANYTSSGIASNGEYLKCEELLGVKFTNTSTGSQVNYWEFKDQNKTSGDISPSHVFSSTGTFPVTLYINRGKICSDSVTKDIKVINGIESVDFDFKNTCVNTEIQFTDKSKAVLNDFTEYRWNFGDNTTSDARNPKKQYALPGNYKVKLNVKTANGCIDSLEKTITIYPQPVSVFDVTKACLNEEVHIANNSTISSGSIVSSLWTFGNQTSSTDVSPEVTYTAPGFYPVTLTSTSDFGCTHKLDDVIEIRIPSKPDFSYINQCFSAPVEFRDLTVSSYNDIVKWEWEVLPGVILNDREPGYKFPADGSFDVKFTVVTTLGCRDSITKMIELKPHPVADFSVDGIELSTGVYVKCDDSKTIHLKNESIDNLTNNWVFDSYGNTTDVSPSFVFPDTGAYNVRLTINQGTLCSDTKTVRLSVLPGLYVDFEQTLACEKNEIEFKDLSTSALNDIIRRDWSAGDNNEFKGTIVKHTYEKYGNYNVQLIVQTNRGCLDTLIKPLTVYSLPKVDVDLPEVCPAQRTRLPNSSAAVNNNQIDSYFWNLGNGTTSSDRLPYVTYAQPGTYDIMLKVVTKAGCSDSISDVVLVRDFIEPVIVQSRTVDCEDKIIVFDATNSKGVYQNYFWEFGDGQTSSLNVDSVIYDDGGEYTVTLTLKDGLCGSFDTTAFIEIISVPEISLGEDFALCPNLTANLPLSASVMMDSIRWSTGAQDVPSITIDGNAGTVIAEVYYKGCYNIDSVYITPSCDVLAPKAFTPNGDGINDYFNVLPANVQSYRLFVFNRWGHEIFTTSELNKGWDGTFKGELQPMDNYTYYAVGVKTDGSPFTIEGAVLLVR